MALHKDEAIVLFKRSYGESDKIVRLFTLSSGKVAAIAKGANKSRKRFANTLEPFNRIRVEYFEKYGRGMVRIENADIVETNSGIEKSLKRACTAGFFDDFVDAGGSSLQSGAGQDVRGARRSADPPHRRAAVAQRILTT